MKKIVYIINSIKNTGPNQVLNNMVSAIDKNKYKVFVISFMEGTKEELTKIEIRRLYIHMEYFRILL